MRRRLRQDAIKPWQYRSWIFIRDPDFRAKAPRVLDLYARTNEGEFLGADEYVLSSDEKTSIKARCRCHPTLAAYDVHQAMVFGRCAPITGIVPFMNLVTQVMTQEPYASAKRVCWIVDSGFTDLTQVRDRLRAFEDRYNASAQPFQCRFTTSDLHDLPDRLDRHTFADRHQESSTALAV